MSCAQNSVPTVLSVSMRELFSLKQVFGVSVQQALVAPEPPISASSASVSRKRCSFSSERQDGAKRNRRRWRENTRRDSSACACVRYRRM